MGEIAVRLAAERSTTKDEFVCAYAEGPPVNGVGVAALSKDLWGHVRHRTSDTGQETPLRVVHGDVEVCDMRVAALVKKYIVWLEITIRVSAKSYFRSICQVNSPMDNSVIVQERKRRPDLRHVEAHNVLGQ